MLVTMDQQEQEELDQDEQDLDHPETLRARGTPSRGIKRNSSPMKPLQEVCLHQGFGSLIFQISTKSNLCGFVAKLHPNAPILST